MGLRMIGRFDASAAEPTVVQPPNNVPYIVAVVLMMVLGVMAVTTLAILRPTTDNVGVITTIVGFIAPTTLSLLAFMKAQETHLSVNSRLDAFMINAKLAAHAQGVTEGRAEGRESADARTDTLKLSAATAAAEKQKGQAP
jgi:hypothetical protein